MRMHYCLDCDFQSKWGICALLHELKTQHVYMSLTFEHGHTNVQIEERIRQSRTLFNGPDMTGVKCSLGSIPRHSLKVGKVFIPNNTKHDNPDDPAQDFDTFGERRH